MTSQGSGVKISVIGLGNPLLSDDTVGLLVVEELRRRHAQDFPLVDFHQNFAGSTDILDDLMGSDKCLIVDSVRTGKAKPGECLEFTLKDIENAGLSPALESHGLNLPLMVQMGRACGYKMPEEVVIFGIEGREFSQFSEQPSPDVQKGLEEIRNTIKNRLTTWQNELLERNSPLNLSPAGNIPSKAVAL